MPTQKEYLSLTGYSGVVTADILAFLGRTTASIPEQIVITQLIDAAEMYFCQQCSRQFANALATTPTVDIVFSSILDAGLNNLLFENFPVKQVNKILLDNITVYDATTPSTASYKIGLDFFVRPDELIFYTKLQSAIDPHNAVEVDYTIEKFWGSDVTLAIKRWVAELFLSKEYGGQSISRMGLTGLNLDFDVKSNPTYIQSVINTYRVPNV
jgi:hypothetical protein